MRIKRVHLKNVGPHEKLDVQLGTGLIGLVGPNGRGKSTLINSIYAALTNDFTRFTKVKADVITNTSSEKDKSYIRIIGEHQGQEFRLNRYLRPNKSTLTVGDGKTLTKATDIADVIENQLEISKAVIDRYVFVNQWEIFRFLSDTPSERAKTFQYLCGTTEATEIHKVCTSYVTKTEATEIVDNSVELKQAISESKKTMDRYKKQGSAAKKLFLSEDEKEGYEAILKRQTDAEDAAEELVTDSEKLRQLRDAQKKTLARQGQLEEAQAASSQRLEEITESGQLEAAQEIVHAKEVRDETAASYDEAVETLNTAHENMSELQSNKPVLDREKYISPAKREAAREKKGNLEGKQEEDQELVDDYDPDSPDVGQCSRCKQTVTKDYQAQIVRDYHRRHALIKSLNTKLSYSTKYDRAIANFEAKVEKYTKEIAEATTAVAELQEAVDQTGDEEQVEAAEALLEEHDQLESAIEGYKTELKKVEATANQRRGQIKSSKARCEKLQELIDGQPAPHQVAHAQQRLRDHNKAKTDYEVAKSCYADAKKSWENSKRMLRQLKLRLSEKTKIQNLLETISEAGDLFHWNNLPKQVSQANLELLVDDINSNLEMFNDPFYVEADDDLSFRVYFPGKPAVKGNQLSGGQKVVLAIAFRAALDSVFGHDVGMLFLDEPTAGLDVDNMGYFHEALQQLAQKSKGDRQLVVITHAQELNTVFDQLIML